MYKRAIVHSGSMYSPWALSRQPLKFARELAVRLNCSTTDTAILLQCIKQVPWEQLIRTTVHPTDFTSSSSFAPTVDRRVIHDGHYSHVTTESGGTTRLDAPMPIPVLVGVMKNEGQQFVTQTNLDEGVTEEDVRKILMAAASKLFASFQVDIIYEILAFHYSEWERSRDQQTNRDGLMEFLGDCLYGFPVVSFAQFYSEAVGPTYFFAFGGDQLTRLEAHPQWLGTLHGHDLIYVFGAPLTDGIDPFGSMFTRSDKALADIALKYWTNFIRTG